MKFEIKSLEDCGYIGIAGNGDRWLFEDPETSDLRISSPVSSPWGRPWIVIPNPQKQRADNSEYPYRLILKLYQSGEGAIPAVLEREKFKGVFAWASGEDLLSCYFFPLRAPKIWVAYSFRSRG